MKETSEVFCGECASILNEFSSLAEKDRKLCYNCHSKIRHFKLIIKESVPIQSNLKGKLDSAKYNKLRKKQGKKRKKAVEFESGDSYNRDLKKYVDLKREINRQNNTYFEEITDKETTHIIRKCNEKLSDHRNRGSAKNKKTLP